MQKRQSAIGLLLYAFFFLWGCDEDEPPLTELKPPHLRVSPETLDFGTFPVSFTAAKEIVLYNSGQINLNFETIELENFSDSFALGLVDTTLGIKDSVILTLEFSPTAPQSYQTQLLFYFNGDNSPLAIPIWGTGLENPLCAPCDTPPGSYCIDENTLAIYEKSSDSCGDDECLFIAQDVLCNIGCDSQTQTCISLDAGVGTTPILPPDQNEDTDGGFTFGDSGTPQNSTSPLYTNDGGQNTLDSGMGSEILPAYIIAQGNIQSCYNCTDWNNPTSCSVSPQNCSFNSALGFGQERHHPQSSALSFTSLEVETLFKDEHTGLIWSRCVNGSLTIPCNANAQTLIWNAAEDLCAQRSPYLGQNFRLPSVGEMLTIVNYTSESNLLAQDSFNLPQESYWTSTPVEPLNPLTEYWMINAMEEKLVGHTVQNQGQVLCVSGSPHGVGTLHSENAMVSDTRTGLTWQKCRHGQNINSAGVCSGTVLPLSFHEALGECENLNLGSHSDWRLPSIRELTTLALYSEATDLIDEFGELGLGLLGRHWSATPHLTATAVWVFHLGSSYWQKGGSSQTLRCVRSP